MHMRFVAISLSFCVAAFFGSAHADEADPLKIEIAKDAPYTVEINKLMQKDGQCLAFLVSETRTQKAFPDFSVNLVFFDQQGIVIGDVNSLIVPLQPGRDIVSRFSFESFSCEDVSRVHVNEILCSQGEDAESCYDKTAIRSRLDKKVTR